MPEIFHRLRCCTVTVGSLLLTFWASVLFPSSRVETSKMLEDGTNICPKMSVTNYLLMLHNIPDQKPQLHCRYSLKSRIVNACWNNQQIIQYLIQQIAHVTINNHLLFVMFLIHILTSIGHLQGGNLQRNTVITNAVKDVHIWI